MGVINFHHFHNFSTTLNGSIDEEDLEAFVAVRNVKGGNPPGEPDDMIEDNLNDRRSRRTRFVHYEIQGSNSIKKDLTFLNDH